MVDFIAYDHVSIVTQYTRTMQYNNMIDLNNICTVFVTFNVQDWYKDNKVK